VETLNNGNGLLHSPPHNHQQQQQQQQQEAEEEHRQLEAEEVPLPQRITISR